MSSRIWRLKLRLSQGLFELFEYFWLLLWVSKTISFTLGGNEWQIRFDRRCIRLGLSWIWGGFQMKIFTGTNKAEQSATSFAYKQRRLYYSLGKIILFTLEFSCMHAYLVVYGDWRAARGQCLLSLDKHSVQSWWWWTLTIMISYAPISCFIILDWDLNNVEIISFLFVANLQQIFPEWSAKFST